MYAAYYLAALILLLRTHLWFEENYWSFCSYGCLASCHSSQIPAQNCLRNHDFISSRLSWKNTVQSWSDFPAIGGMNRGASECLCWFIRALRILDSIKCRSLLGALYNSVAGESIVRLKPWNSAEYWNSQKSSIPEFFEISWIFYIYFSLSFLQPCHL